MKFSRFNTIIPLTDKINLLYNSFSDKYVLFKNSFDLTGCLKKHLSMNPTNISSFYINEMIKGGCIIDDSIDEMQMFKDVVAKIEQNEQQFLLTVNPTMNCNFQCWYCYENHLKDSRMDQNTLENTQKFINRVIGQNEKLKYFSLSFFGGEPLLYYKDVVKPLIEYFDTICRQNTIEADIGFTSNGYLLTSSMIRFFRIHNIRSFQITLDGYREEHNKVRFISEQKGSYDTILENVKLLLKNEIHVLLRINYTANNIFNVKEILNDLLDITLKERVFLSVNFQRVWQDESRSINIEDVTMQTISCFKKNGFNVSRRRSNYLKASCYADKRNQAVINYNGDVFKCTARNFSPEKREGFLNDNGEILWENDAVEKRMDVKFNNKSCLYCRIAPLCNGGCTQQALEHEQEYCMLEFDDRKKDQLILDRFMNRFIG